MDEYFVTIEVSKDFFWSVFFEPICGSLTLPTVAPNCEFF